MPNQFVIWGCAGHAKVLASMLVDQGDYVSAFFDNKDVLSILPGIPIYLGEAGFRKWINSVSDIGNISGLVAIGGHRGLDRIHLQKLFERAGLRLPSLIHPAAYVCPTAEIGKGVQVLAQAVVAADSRIGDACIINHKASVDHECILGNGVHLAPGATLCGCVIIEDNVMIGAGSVVLPHIKIGAGALIGAGAVVTKDVPAAAVVAGNPARLFYNIN